MCFVPSQADPYYILLNNHEITCKPEILIGLNRHQLGPDIVPVLKCQAKTICAYQYLSYISYN